MAKESSVHGQGCFLTMTEMGMWQPGMWAPKERPA